MSRLNVAGHLHNSTTLTYFDTRALSLRQLMHIEFCNINTGVVNKSFTLHYTAPTMYLSKQQGQAVSGVKLANTIASGLAPPYAGKHRRYDPLE